MFKEIVEISDVFDNKVKISFTKKQMCSCCSLGHICGRGEEELVIDDWGFSLKKGDKVEIEIDEKKGILANLILFFFPSIILIAGLILFQNKGELLSFVLALLVVCVYYLIVKLILKLKGKDFKLKIIRKI
ncbi:MAG: SoxR reducing system RseC family protein [Candidatus Omnitrophota bacterium]